MVVTFARLLPQEPARLHLTGFGNSAGLPPWDGLLSPFSRDEWKPTDELAWLAPFWIVGVLIFHLRGLTSWIATLRLRTKGVCRAADLWQDRVARLASRLKLARPVVLLESCFAEVPVVIGYLRPVILVPVGLMTGLPAGQVEAILLHELAHIRRFDYLVNLLQVFVEGLLFYHPAVWWISGVIRAERENCCDDLVVVATGSAIEYATALASLEQRRENAGMALAATGGGLVNRIQRLLGRKERGYAGAMPVFTAAILTVTVVAALGALQIGSGAIAGIPGGVPGGTAKGVISGVKGPVTGIPGGVIGVIGGVTNGVISGVKAGVVAPALVSTSDKTTTPLLAQAQPTVQNPMTPEQRKAKEDALRKELATPYRKWLDEDVAYIISDEERKAFQQVYTDEEREHFVEQFWARRDPTPGTEENESKEEHYRRIGYANEHFAADIPGWRTDRGRIYIQYGPPDEIDAHGQSSGTPGIPVVLWRYKHIEGVGNNIVIAFVDTEGNGEYKMTMDPNAEDALPHQK
jgi:GWxTD domain-containing protein